MVNTHSPGFASSGDIETVYIDLHSYGWRKWSTGGPISRTRPQDAVKYVEISIVRAAASPPCRLWDKKLTALEGVDTSHPSAAEKRIGLKNNATANRHDPSPGFRARKNHCVHCDAVVHKEDGIRNGGRKKEDGSEGSSRARKETKKAPDDRISSGA